MILPQWEVEQKPCPYTGKVYEKKFDFDIRLNDIESHFKKIIINSPDIGLFEFGINRSRFDLIRIDCHKRIIRGYEFKISLVDFKRDIKWHHYLPYCNTFTFVTPYKMITKGDLPSNIGILQIFKWTYPECDDFRIGSTWIRKPKTQKMETEKYIEVISLLLNRVKYRQGDFIVMPKNEDNYID